MARVTIEDCLKNVDNRFELVLLATKRAREIISGSMPTIQRDNDKSPIIALREIAHQTIKIDDLRERLLRSIYQNEIGFGNDLDFQSNEIINAIENESSSFISEEIDDFTTETKKSKNKKNSIKINEKKIISETFEGDDEPQEEENENY